MHTEVTNSCTALHHPRGEVTGKVVKVTTRFTYRERVCPVCGKTQGVALVRKS